MKGFENSENFITNRAALSGKPYLGRLSQIIFMTRIYHSKVFETESKVWSASNDFAFWFSQEFSLHQPTIIHCGFKQKPFKNCLSKNSQNGFLNDTKHFLSLWHRHCW